MYMYMYVCMYQVASDEMQIDVLLVMSGSVWSEDVMSEGCAWVKSG